MQWFGYLSSSFKAFRLCLVDTFLGMFISWVQYLKATNATYATCIFSFFSVLAYHSFDMEKLLFSITSVFNA
jgi:hypothetical protein